MDRRELFTALGSLGVGVSVEADHGDKKTDGPARPVAGLHAHFCGIHVAKNNPKFQMIVQHYCGMQADHLHQCLLFDSSEKNAKLIGIEYIISDAEYRKLDDKEKRYWHPHTYEVLAGGLTAPDMKPEAEMNFMKALLTTWGKTWHTWPDPKTAVPEGEPLLIWSLGGDAQSDDAVVAARDKECGVDTAAIRARRAQEFGLKVPQIPQPKSMDDLGRQWTASGDDQPTKT